MIRAQSAFPELSAIADELAPFWRDGVREIDLPDLRFRMVEGDARATLPAWQDKADAWFLDGFSPAKNPELWGDGLMAQALQHECDHLDGKLYVEGLAPEIKREALREIRQSDWFAPR